MVSIKVIVLTRTARLVRRMYIIFIRSVAPRVVLVMPYSLSVSFTHTHSYTNTRQNFLCVCAHYIYIVLGAGRARFYKCFSLFIDIRYLTHCRALGPKRETSLISHKPLLTSSPLTNTQTRATNIYSPRHTHRNVKLRFTRYGHTIFIFIPCASLTISVHLINLRVLVFLGRGRFST